LIPNLVASAMIGTGVPKYSRGVAEGLVRWIPKIRVNTIDTGTVGAGTNVPLPLIVPTPLLYAALVTGHIAEGLRGVFMPILANGLANGLTVAFFQMLIRTNHPSVGVGGGVARFSAPPARSDMVAGFNAVGLNGPASSRGARAIARGLDTVFSALVLPLVIVGPAAPAPSAGSGFGQII
jgi:hypothetical protein